MKLLDYQEKTKDFILSAKRGYIALDLGMGKTLTSLACAFELGKKNALLVAEKSEITSYQNFKKEVDTHFEGFTYVSLRETDIKDLPSGRCVCGINPDMLAKIDKKTIEKNFDCLIVDEATFAKNTTTGRFKAIHKVAKEVEYVFLLSGTPMLNGSAELYAPLLLLDHSMVADKGATARKAFEKVFSGGHYRQIRSTKGVDPEYARRFYWKYFAWWNKGANHLRPLRYLLRDKFFILSKSESKLFKKKTREVKEVDMSLQWIGEYSTAWNDYLVEAKKRSVDMENVIELKRLIENGQCYQVNSRWKALQVVEDIASGVYGKDRIVVFTMFIETQNIIHEELKKRGIAFKTFDEIDEFKSGDDQVIVGTIMANGKGGNLPEANICLMVDMHYVPSHNIQSENRIDRPQQQKDMRVVYYMTKGEDVVDNHVRNINKDKMSKINRFMRKLEEEEVPEILAEIEEMRKKFPKEMEILGI